MLGSGRGSDRGVAQVVSHVADVQKMHGVDVIGSGRTADSAAAQGEGGEEAGGEAHAAMGGGGVHHDTGNGLLQTEFTDHFFVVGVDGEGVADAAVVQQGVAELAGFLPVIDDIEADDGGELFLGEGGVGANAGFVGDEQAGAFGDADAGDLGDGLSIAAHDGGVHGAVAAFHDGLHLGEVVAFEEEAALGDDFTLDVGSDDGVADDGLFGGADGAVVESLGGEDLGHSVLHVGAAFDVGRHVAGAHAEGGGTGAVGSLHHAGAAGGEDEVGDLHEFGAAFEGGHAHAAHEVGAHAALVQGFLNILDGSGDALLGGGMGGEDDGVAGLQGDERLVDDSGGGVGGGHHTGDDADRHGDLDHLVDLVFFKDADSLHVLDAGIDLLCGEQVLGLLVGSLAVAGLFVSHLGQFFGMSDADFGNGFDDSVDAILAKLRVLSLSGTGGTHKGTSFLYGQQILVYHLTTPLLS